MADTCPKCGRMAVGSDKCPGCGFVISLYDRYLAEMGGDPSRPGTVASPVATEPGAPIVWTPAEPRLGEHDGPPSWQPVPDRVRSTRRRLLFCGMGRDLFSIWIVCAFLTLATLGIYYFWAKTRVRRYVYGQTDLEG